MRITRLLSLVLLLQSREFMTAAALAEELGVSERTVYRDVLTLAEAGVPIYADRGRQGGYRLISGYHSRLTGLTRTQAEALFLSGVPGPAGEMGLTQALDTAQQKVVSGLPPRLRGAATTAAQRFHLDAPRWFRRQVSPPLLAELAQATWQDRTVTVSYRRRGGETVTRTLEPYGLILKSGVWYLAGRVPDPGTVSGSTGAGSATDRQPSAAAVGNQRAGERGGTAAAFRVYRVDRFVDATTTDTVFERDAGFDLAGFWADRATEFARAILTDTVTVRLSRRGQQLLPHLVDPVAAADALASATDADGDGWVQVELPVESQDVAFDELLRFGPEAELLAPAELRSRMAAAAQQLAARYRQPPA